MLPNFFIIGAGRSGTTSLHHYLKQHPQLYMSPVKSPSYFFCHDLGPIEDLNTRLITKEYFIRDLKKYQALFNEVQNEKAIGEVSPVYLASVNVAQQIKQTVPDAKIIAIVRNPIDRVYARFLGRLRDGYEKANSFEELVEKELQKPLIRDVAFSTYLASGFCHHFLKTYFDNFSRENIRIYVFDDFIQNPQNVVDDIFTFLELPAHSVNTKKKHNSSNGNIENKLLKLIWKKSSTLRAFIRPYLPRKVRDQIFPLLAKESAKIPMKKETRQKLINVYKDDIKQLQELIGKDLSHWLAE